MKNKFTSDNRNNCNGNCFHPLLKYAFMRAVINDLAPQLLIENIKSKEILDLLAAFLEEKEQDGKQLKRKVSTDFHTAIVGVKALLKDKSMEEVQAFLDEKYEKFRRQFLKEE